MDFSYINDKGRKVSGPPATIHFIYTEMGGVENYNDYVGEKYIRQFLRHQSENINREIERDAKRKKYKIV